jgi:transmembrane sensor
MSDQSGDRAPEHDAAPASDPALDALLERWQASAEETIDVESAWQAVAARRRADGTARIADLTARRSLRDASVPMWRRPAVRIAAALLLTAGGSALWYNTRRPVPAAQYVTTTGVSRDVRLADGTAVHLGPASLLTVLPGFGASRRDVTLRGEAWFKVTHNASMPFRIQVGSTVVEDIGTAFLVRESRAQQVSVRVAEGSVRMTTTAARRDSSVLLQAGDGATASPSGITLAMGGVSTGERTALAAGRLTFNDASLVEVEDALQRWYGVTLIVENPALALRHVTADFTGEPVSRIAAMLGLTLGVGAEAHGDTIVLHAGAGVPSRP